MDATKRLLLANKAWAEEKTSLKPDFFEESAKGQSPEILWIGCADSRVPPEAITGTEPGELFVHRNVANLAVHTDFNLLSVLQYAVEHLHVKHIVVCGHYGCGGVTAAMGHQNLGLLDHWLWHIKDVYRTNRHEVDLVEAGPSRVDRLVELNVTEQVRNLTRTTIVQKAWADRQAPTVHGWVYALATGRLKELCRVEPGAPIDEAHRYDVAGLA